MKKHDETTRAMHSTTSVTTISWRAGVVAESRSRAHFSLGLDSWRKNDSSTMKTEQTRTKPLWQQSRVLLLLLVAVVAMLPRWWKAPPTRPPAMSSAPLVVLTSPPPARPVGELPIPSRNFRRHVGSNRGVWLLADLCP